MRFIAGQWGGYPTLNPGTLRMSRNRPVDLQAHKKLADSSHGGAEEEFEVVGGLGVLPDGGLDGFLRDGAGITEVDQGGEGIVASGTVVWPPGCDGDGYGEVVELVFEFKHDALGGFLADAGDAGEGGVVAGTNGGDEAIGVDAAQDRDGELGADAADGEELLEEPFLLSFGEAEEGNLVFADVSMDVQGGFCAFAGERGEGGDADGDVVAHAGALDDGLVRSFGEETSAKVSNHAWLIVACGD